MAVPYPWTKNQASNDLKTLFDAYTILMATTDNTPVALTVGEQTLVGRKTGGTIAALSGAEVLALLTGQAGATFSFNSQDITAINSLALGTVGKLWYSGAICGFNKDFVITPDTLATHIGGGIAGTITTGSETASWGVEQYSEASDLDGSSSLVSFGMVLRPTGHATEASDGLLWLLDHQTTPDTYRLMRIDASADQVVFEKIVSSTTYLEVVAASFIPKLDLAVRSPVNNNQIQLTGGIDVNSGLVILYGKSHATLPGMIKFLTPNAALSITERITLSGAVDTAVLTLTAVTVTGLVLTAGAILAGHAPLASPTFTGTVTLPSTVTVGAAVLTFPGATGTFATLAGTEEFDNKTLDASVAKGTWTTSGTWTVPAHSLNGVITTSVDNPLKHADDISQIQILGGLSADGCEIILCGKSDGGNPGGFKLATSKATPANWETVRLTISGNADVATATWANIAHSGFVLNASQKINPVSGVAGFSVVSTALTLGSAGSMIVPHADMGNAASDAARDALAGNVNGAIAIDSVGVAGVYKKWCRANGAWKSVTIA